MNRFTLAALAILPLIFGAALAYGQSYRFTADLEDQIQLTYDHTDCTLVINQADGLQQGIPIYACQEFSPPPETSSCRITRWEWEYESFLRWYWVYGIVSSGCPMEVQIRIDLVEGVTGEFVVGLSDRTNLVGAFDDFAESGGLQRIDPPDTAKLVYSIDGGDILTTEAKQRLE